MKENETDRESLFPPEPPIPKEKEKERERAAANLFEEENAATAAKEEALSTAQTSPAQAAPPAYAGAAAETKESINYQAFIEYFNRTMPPDGIPPIRFIEGPRRIALMARCRQYGKQGIFEMVNRAAASRFLNGGGEKGWRATIDWLLRPSNFLKILEGRYDDNFHVPVSPQTMKKICRAANRRIEQERHEEIQESIRRRESRCVSYEEYQKMLREGLIPPPPTDPTPQG